MFFKPFSVFVCLLTLNQFLSIINTFEVGFSYKYKYETNVEIINSLVKNSSEYLTNLFNVDFDINLDVLKLDGNDAFLKLSIAKSTDSNVQDFDKYPILFEYDKNRLHVINVFYDSRESTEALNFKKGILDLFNFNFESSQEVSTVGKCDIEFLKLNDENTNELKIKKRKINCNRNEFLDDDEFNRSDETLDLGVNRLNELIYEVDNKIIKNVRAVDHVDILFALNQDTARTIIAKQIIKLVEKVEVNDNSANLELKEDSNGKRAYSIGSEVYDSQTDNLILLRINNTPKAGNKLEETIANEIKSYKKVKSGSTQASKKFLKLVKALRDENISEKGLSKLPLKKYLKHDRVGAFTIDAFVAAQNKETLNSILKELDLKKVNSKLDKKAAKLIEKFLISSSLCTHTTLKNLNEALSDIVSLNTLFNLNLRDVAGLSVGAIAHAASLKKTNASNAIVADYYNLVKNEFLKCKNEDCKAFFLNSLSNAKLIQSVSEIYEPEIANCKNKFSKVCLLSLKSLRKFSPGMKLSQNLVDNLLQIFYLQSNHSESSSIRLEALNLLLHNEEMRNYNEIILNVLLTIFEANDYEFTVYAYKTLLNLVKSSRTFKEQMEPIISKFYHKYLFLKGNSEVLRNSLFGAKTGSLNYDLKQLTSYPDSIMKSIEFSINYEDQLTEKLINVLSFDIYSENLNTIMGNSKSKEDPTAGLELSILNTKIKKTEFFRGYSSLLNAIWNAPSSLTTVFETNFLLNDQNEFIFLQNGLILNLNTIGALSIDVSALAEVSMWSQSAKTLLQTSVAVAIESSLKIYNHIDKNEIQILNYDFDTKIKTEFYLNAEFQKDPLKLCMKLIMNKIKLKQANNHVIENKQQNEKQIKSKSKKSLIIQPATYMLSRKAISLC